MGIFVRMNLKTKAASFIAVILVVVISLSTTILTLAVVPRLRSSLLMSSTLIGENLVKDIKKTVDLGISLDQLEGLSQNLTEINNQYTNLGYICITDPNGTILYRSDQSPEGLQKSLNSAKKGTSSKDNANVATESLIDVGDSSLYDIIIPIVSSDTVKGSVHIGLKSEVVRSQVNAILYRSLAVGLISFLVATGLIVFFMTRFISEPLENLSGAARKISSGDLVPPAALDRHDEIGQLSNVFRTMVENLSTFISHSQDSSDSLEKSAGELTEVAQKLSDSFDKQVAKLDEVVTSIGEMDALSESLTDRAKALSESAVDSSSSIMETTSAISEINRHMSEINASVENISSAILEMSTTIREVAAGAENTAAMAEETKEAISKINEGIQNMDKLADQSRTLSDNLKRNASDIGSRAMKETIQGILSIQEDVQHAEAAMKTLSDRVDNIGEIIGVIDEITEQTNLLALNASIISAQAGEHGRSFAVVASEIRELSVRTSDSTKKISTLIKGVQAETDNYSDYMNRVIKSVVKGLNLGQEAEKALEMIVASAHESADMAAIIARVSKEQAEASEKVSDSVEVFTRSAEEIKKATKEEAKGSEFVQESMEKTKQMIEMVYRATEEQNRGSKLTSETSDKARETSEEVFRATKKERELTGDITKAVEVLKSISQDNSGLIMNLIESSALLNSISLSLKKDMNKYTTASLEEKPRE